MANLYLTHKCNRGCSFCFARKVLKEGKGAVDDILTVDEIERLLEHYSNQFPEIGLLGGEPFLYPYLDKVLELLWRRRILPKLFTSATNPLPAGLENIRVEESPIHFIVNIGTRDSYSEEKYTNLLHFFSKFHAQSSLSYTIFDLDADFGFLFEIINQFKLVRSIRVGVALPIYKGGNQYIQKEEYTKLGKYVVGFAEYASEQRVVLGMDCGFVACMFTTKEIGALQRCGVRTSFCCGAAVDIGPGLEAWNCFPLFQLHRENVLEAKNMEELIHTFQVRMKGHFGEEPGIFAECGACKHYKRKTCGGGCKSFKSI
jgi:sulfatase maturation enzyme AslB (radical SAM superfamily)